MLCSEMLLEDLKLQVDDPGNMLNNVQQTFAPVVQIHAWSTSVTFD